MDECSIDDPDRRSATAWVGELDEDECWRRLAATPIGRLAFNCDGQPMIMLVNHAVDGQTIVFRTDRRSTLADLYIGERSAFEVDGIDSASRTGWSVLVTGRLQWLPEPERLSVPLPVPWPPSRGDVCWRLVSCHVSGRAVHRHLPDTEGHYTPFMATD